MKVPFSPFAPSRPAVLQSLRVHLSNGRSTNLALFPLILVVVLAALTVGSQFYYLLSNHGMDYLETEQLGRHLAILHGTSSAPYRYRLLSTWLTELWLRSCSLLGIESPFATWSTLRIIQNVTILSLSYIYFRKLSISRSASVVGLLLLSHGMLVAFYNSDLSVYTYTEIILYLWAAVAVMRGDLSMMPAISILAALNRESGVFIPFLILANHLRWTTGPVIAPKRVLHYFVISLICFIGTYLSVFAVVGSASYSNSGYGQVYPGLQLLRYNLANMFAWYELALMYSALPVSLLFLNSWPAFLRWCLPLLVAPWFGGQFVFGTVNETRLFLVPLVVVFIPATLSLIDRLERHTPVRGETG